MYSIPYTHICVYTYIYIYICAQGTETVYYDSRGILWTWYEHAQKYFWCPWEAYKVMSPLNPNRRFWTNK